VAFAGLLLIASGCEKLVGISDTEVSAAGSSAAGADSSGAGKPSMPSAGTHSGGGALSGDAGSAGTDTSGSSGMTGTAGTPAMGGNSGSGGAPASGGSSGSVSSAGSAGAAGAGACPCSAPTPTCENGKCVVRGPEMIKIPEPTNPFYIDSSEVTAQQYAAFLAANYPTTGQRAGCSWNKSYMPGDITGGDDLPVVYVDFCDAVAYCTWADKKLCGAIGGGTLPANDPSDPNPAATNPKDSQWYLACAGPNSSTYCYGNIENDNACNEHNGNSFPGPVKSFPACQGHYAGLYDMGGNAIEWIDSCQGNTDNLDKCEIIGGSWASSPQAGCFDFDLDQRDDQAPALGFRCCSK
jgi:hypothetical protein